MAGQGEKRERVGVRWGEEKDLADWLVEGTEKEPFRRERGREVELMRGEDYGQA